MTITDRRTITHSRAWYESGISEFLCAQPETILGELGRNSTFAVSTAQMDAWLAQILSLKRSLACLEGYIALEFAIPRMGRRIDAVVILKSICFVIEYKVGEEEYPNHAIEQVWDYALDLKNFHAASHDIPVVPVLVATDAGESADNFQFERDPDGLFRPVSSSAEALRSALDRALVSLVGADIDSARWRDAPYRPTPTILEAARALYAHHTVVDIARTDAGAENLAVTSHRIDEIVDRSIARGRKTICFVTGVPGAGKTLVGLNAATRHRRELKQPTHASFLSGNGPLVWVLHAALINDEVARRRAAGETVRKGKVSTQVKSVIQNVHHFRDEYVADPSAPFDHVVIFDEAQRAWNREQTGKFMVRHKKSWKSARSEPEFLISVLDRHKDWAVIVCLVGGGQEIHTGEAGIGAWLEAINNEYRHWDAYISSKLFDSEYQAAGELRLALERQNTYIDDSLHLAVSMRSFRAENVSTFVKAVLDGEVRHARKHLKLLENRYPLVLTRDLERAKRWVRAQARGSERYGLMASSRAQRLKPHAIDVRVNIDPVHWFLKDRTDTRSSYYLEDAATEFQVQGLEVDWACVTWDGDLRYQDSGWSYHDFRGSAWQRVHKEERRRYVLNAYRVLLTRARQGMVVVIPPGDRSDPTRLPEFYDPTFEYLQNLGVPVI